MTRSANKHHELSYGPAAVRNHADETGLTEGIRAIVKFFGKDAIKDIEIHSVNRVSVLHELSPELHRVVPGVQPQESVKDWIKKTKGK